MVRPSTLLRVLALSAALAAMSACSSGTNNKSTGTATAAKSVASAASAPATVARTVAPAASVPAATQPGTPAPAASRPPATASPAPAVVDTGLQQALEAAALKQSDLPAGYSPSSQPSRELTTPGVVAQYSTLFTNNLTGGTVVFVDSVFGFKDVAAATSMFKDSARLLTDNSQNTIKLEPLTGGVTLGDQTEQYKATITTTAFTYQGYAILWRRGRIGVTMLVAGQPGPQSIDEVVPLATKQDENVKAVKQ